MIPIRAPAPQKMHGCGKATRTKSAHSFTAMIPFWLPASLLQQNQRERFATRCSQVAGTKAVALHFNKGIAGAPVQAIAATRDTATNPRLLEAFALVIIADGERPAYPDLPRPPMD